MVSRINHYLFHFLCASTQIQIIKKLVSSIHPDVSYETKLEHIPFLNATENPLNNDANNQR